VANSAQRQPDAAAPVNFDPETMIPKYLAVLSSDDVNAEQSGRVFL
jgi:hypothetical protein